MTICHAAYSVIFHYCNLLFLLPLELVRAAHHRNVVFNWHIVGNAVSTTQWHLLIRQIKSEKTEGAKRTNRILSPALEYISTNYTDENISISYLSELCDISEPYFRRIFQIEFGYSPAIYIRKKRLEYAYSLLLSGEYSITDTAMLSGFNAPAYFSREFKKEYGYAPKDFFKM